MKNLWIALLLINLLGSDSSEVFKNVVKERQKLLRKEMSMMLGNDITLNVLEREANNIIMNLKHDAVDYGFKHPEYYNYSKHFFRYKDIVKTYKLFQIIKEMPKGALLHTHDLSLLGPDYILQLTYMENLFVCFEDTSVQFFFAESLPEKPCKYRWELMKTARNSSKNITLFDAELRKYFTLVVDNPEEEYKHINDVWTKFAQHLSLTTSFYSYKPIWEKHFYDTLKAVRDDNIMYVEIRNPLPPIYDLKGSYYDSVDSAESYKKVLNQFLQDYPDFFGAKLIYSGSRNVESEVVRDNIKLAHRLKKELPDFFAGFDLSKQEDLGKPNKAFLDILSEAAGNIDYFFHAGETNWYGFSSDENLFDVIALGTKRIGHGYAMIKHPVLVEEIKKRNIAVEVNVVSNQVLNLVSDIRNHPLAAYLAQDLPVVLSGDNAGAWESDPISHDFYVTFVGVASRHADLRLLKKLALNSIYYSSYHDKDKMVREFEARWSKFIKKVVDYY